MNKFLFRFIIFSLPLFLYIFLSFIFVVRNNFEAKPTVDFSKTSILCLGDSHVKNSINPKFFNELENVSSKSEPIVFSFYKLKTIVKDAPNLKLVIFGFAPHNISAYQDDKLKDQSWTNENLYKYWTLFNKDEVNFELPEDYYSTLIIKDLFLLKRRNLKNGYIGSFRPKQCAFEKNDLDQILNRHFPNNKLSELSINYLDSIVNFVSSNKLELVIINTPVYSTYQKHIPNNVLSEYETIVTKVNKKENMYFFNYASYLNDQKYFKNHDHVCSLGADSISFLLSQELNKTIYFD